MYFGQEENTEGSDNDVNVYFPVKVYEKFRDSESMINYRSTIN